MTEFVFRFEIDGRRAGPDQTKWEDAARDAVAAGYAQWKPDGTLVLDSARGGAVEKVEKKPGNG